MKSERSQDEFIEYALDSLFDGRRIVVRTEAEAKLMPEIYEQFFRHVAQELTARYSPEEAA